MADKVPGKAWVVTFCGTAINLCLGILYAWSIWLGAIVPKDLKLVGTQMTGINEGWVYMSNAAMSNPFALCVLIFALFMIPGGRIQDKFGPKVGAITGGLFLAVGCIISGLMQSYGGLIFGFGILGGIGMGIGYAAPTPAALKWFGPHKRGLIAGLVVGGYGGAALYISPLANFLVKNYGISNSFIYLGIFFAAVVIIAGSQLAWPEPGYVPPAAPGVATGAAKAATAIDWSPSELPKVWQFYALMLMFIGTTQSGLMIINFARPILEAAGVIAFAWLLPSFGGLVNAVGRVGTGMYSDKIGRANAYTLNCILSALALIILPQFISAQNVFLVFVAVGIAYWQYGGGLALMPAFTADFFGPKNLGMNYGLVFIGWGLGFFMARIAGGLRDAYQLQGLYYGFYMSAAVLIIAVLLARITKRPMHVTE